MGPFFTFVGIIAAIWLLSLIASVQNKRREMERRRMYQMQMQRAGLQPQRPQQQRRPTGSQPVRRISPGIAARFPDVLLPPALPPRRVGPIAQQQRRVPVPQQRRSAQPQRRAGGRPVPAPAPNAPPAYQGSAPLSSAAPAVASVSAARQTATAAKAVDATAVARWAKPATLRQQFILTEIFQPPLALRDRPDQH